MNIIDLIVRFLNETGIVSFFKGDGWMNLIMIVIGCVFLYLAIKKGYEPYLLIPIAIGIILVNIYPDIYVTKDAGKTLKEIELPMDTVTGYPPHMQEYGLTLADYQYLEMPQQDGENYTIHVMTQSGETEGLVFTAEDQGENWSFTGVFDENS